MAEEKKSAAVLAAGGVAAVLASACCLGPLLLVSVGLGGAWLGQLQVLEPFRPFTIAIALIALFFAYRRIFRPQAACAPGEACATPRNRIAYKALFWGVAVLVLVAIAYPYVVPYFY
ncbi:MAG: mercuric ion transporter MerT [Proteobacteria bacterium]|nr:mercuric ion transporter MerT [Pseudomonadota bacterium]